MLEILSYGFFQNALIVAVLASIVCGIIGTFVVIKRIVFMSGGISHSSFGGLGLAYYLGLEPLLGAFAASVLSALAIGTVAEKGHERSDTVIGAIWSIGMAIGIIFIYMTPGYASDLFSYLFGNILLVSSVHIYMMLALTAAVVLAVFLFFNAFRAVAFDEEFARTMRLPVFALNMAIMLLIALTVVVVIKAVGIILLIALLTLPAAAANKFTKDMKSMMSLAIIIGLASNIGGLMLSYALDFPTGAFIIIIAAAIYLFSLAAPKR